MKLSVLLLLLIPLLLSGCRTNDKQLEEALVLAKNNRQELEKVLIFYKDDSLKLDAAKFLIKNMPGHYSYTEAVDTYYNAVEVLVDKKYPIKDTRDSLEKLAMRFDASVFETVPDVEVVKAELLIATIEEAFMHWKYGNWTTQLTYKDFCEYLLPYKSTELQPLDNWRTFYLAKYDEGLDELQYCDLYKNSLVRAVCEVNRNMKNGVRPYLLEYDAPLVQRLSTKIRLPFGVCDDYVQIATSILRSNGIPVAVDFTPQWAARASGHSWNVILPNNGKCIPFSGVGSDPGQPHMPDEKMAKVYRKTYAINPAVEELIKAEKKKNLPEVFHKPFLKDVTSEYMHCSDITLDVKEAKNKYVYLAVFNNQSWSPVAFSKIKNEKAVFKDVGRDVVYLPVCYTDGKPEPIGEPFLLTSRGSVQPLIPDMEKKQSMILYRKYPVYGHVFEIAHRIIGGEFQASDNENFSDAITLHKIEKWGTTGEEVNVPSSGKGYRYWRLFNPKDSHCNVAEITFIDRTTHQSVYGDIIGTEGSWQNNPAKCKEAAFDKNLLTAFDGPEGVHAWVGMDFGKPVDIEKIIYTPRGDGNTIEIGDEYELFYWGNARWNSLGKQVANSVRLQYDNVPSGALYWIEDLSKGKEERIFEYKEGKQVFW